MLAATLLVLTVLSAFCCGFLMNEVRKIKKTVAGLGEVVQKLGDDVADLAESGE